MTNAVKALAQPEAAKRIATMLQGVQRVPTRHIHFIGIGGAGLSALAKVMLARGDEVSGSDAASNRLTQELADAGAKVYAGHAAENISRRRPDCDDVCCSR